VIPIPRAVAEPLGELVGGGDELTGVTADSRTAGPGDLFVAVRGGRAFVEEARARGAATLVPDDDYAALATLAEAVRARTDARVVAITGSVGKTSTKDILAALCAPLARTIAAEHGFNNEIGLPLTLCRVEPETEIAVLEMSMRGLGQIAELAAIGRPHVAAITNVGPVHLELLGSLANIARAKAEVVGALPPGGIAVVPAAPSLLDAYLPRRDVELRRFGAGGDYSLLEVADEGETTRVVVDARGTTVELAFPPMALFHASNVVVALAIYDALGLPLDRAAEGARLVRFSRWRGEELPLDGDGLLINDAWNANPTAMRAAIEHLVVRSGNRRTVAVLGNMAELGDEAPLYHEEVGRLLAANRVDVVIAVGELARAYVQGDVGVAHWVPDADAAIELLDDVLQPGDCVLVKGSRSVGLERVAECARLVRA
jgi:UDP-N-acetylmuramoyl-tripeptide--D-alanyl-D-alanine ligase